MLRGSEYHLISSNSSLLEFKQDKRKMSKRFKPGGGDTRYPMKGQTRLSSFSCDKPDKTEKMLAVVEARLGNRLQAALEENERLSSEGERLQGIIVKAYQRLGFTGAKNQTMRILGTGLPNAKDSERVQQRQKQEMK